MIIWWRQLRPRIWVESATMQSVGAEMNYKNVFSIQFRLFDFRFFNFSRSKSSDNCFFIVCQNGQWWRSRNWRPSTANNRTANFNWTCWSTAKSSAEIRIANSTAFSVSQFSALEFNYNREVFDEFALQLWAAIENFSLLQFSAQFHWAKRERALIANYDAIDDGEMQMQCLKFVFTKLFFPSTTRVENDPLNCE